MDHDRLCGYERAPFVPAHRRAIDAQYRGKRYLRQSQGAPGVAERHAGCGILRLHGKLLSVLGGVECEARGILAKSRKPTLCEFHGPKLLDLF